nr:hypothetical protein [Tanacetum cinerariifolium]
MAFVSSPSTNSTNEVPTAHRVSTASTKVSIANLSDATVYAFLSNQSNGSQLIHDDLEQIHEDDLKEMDLKWQLALLSMRAKRIWNQDSPRRTVNVEETPPKDMVAINGVGFEWSYMAEDEVPTNMALMDFSDSEIDLSYSGLEEFQQPEFESYGPKFCKIESKNACENNPIKLKEYTEVKESSDVPLVKKFMSDGKLEKKTVVPTDAKIEFANCNYHQKGRVVSRNNYTRVNYNNSTKKTHPNAHMNMAPRAVLMKIGLRLLNTARHVNTAHPKTTVHCARPMSHFSKSAQSTVQRPYQQKTALTNKSFSQTVNTDRPRQVNTTRPVNTVRPRPVNSVRPRPVNTVRPRLINFIRPRAINTARPNSAVVNAVRVNKVNPVKDLACWVWRPTKPNGASIILKRHNYIDVQGSKAFKVYNIRTRKVEENLHIRFLEDKPSIGGNGPKWVQKKVLNATNDEPQSSCDAGNKDDKGVHKDSGIDDQEKSANSSNDVNTVGLSINIASTDFNTGSLNINIVSPTVSTASPEATHADFFGDKPEGDMSNINTTYQVHSTPNTIIHKDQSLDLVIGDVQSGVLTKKMIKTTHKQGFISTIHEEKTHEDLNTCLFACFLSQIKPTRVAKALNDPAWVVAMQEELLQNKKDERGIVIKNKERLVTQGYTQEEGIDYDKVFAPAARIEARRLFLTYASFMGFMVYEMDVKSAFLYGRVEEEVCMCQPLGFKDLDHPDKVYKVVKALYGLHQALKACQDKYVTKVLRKFNLSDVKTTSTPVDTEKPLVKDAYSDDIDVHLYRSMIGSLMYLTTSRPDIILNFHGEGSTVPVESYHTPTDEAASTCVDVKHGGAATTVTSLDAGQGSGNIDKTPSMPYDLPLPRVNILGSDESSMTLQELTVLCTILSQKVESMEADLKKTKQVYRAAYTKLIIKVKRLEKSVKTGKVRRKAHIVVFDNEEEFEDPSKQGRNMIEEIDQDAEVTLTYTRRRAVSTSNGGVSTASRMISTVEESVSTVGASMLVSTAGMVDKDVRLQEQFDEEERKRIAKVQEAAQTFTKEE